MKKLATRFLKASLKPRVSVLFLGLYTAALVFLLTFAERQLLHYVLQSPLSDLRLAEEQIVPDSVAYQKDYEFTSNWFTWNIPVWERALAEFKGRPGLKYLEIGLFEGRSALWMLENILTHPTARMIGIDIFTGPVKDRYLTNIQRAGAEEKIQTVVEKSQVALRRLPLNSFDVIYIDGSHVPEAVLEDAVLSWGLLKDEGVLIFDDYRWFRHAPGDDTDFPKLAIDAFLRCFEGHFDVVHNSYQLILRKRPQESS